MDKRFFLALLLTAIVIIAPPLLFPGMNARRTGRTGDSSIASRADTAGRPATVRDTAPTTIASPTVATTNASPAEPTRVVPAATVPAATVPAETTTVKTRLASYAFSSLGAAPVSVVLDSYPSRRPGAKRKAAAELLPPHAVLARYRLALGADTVALDTVSFNTVADQNAGRTTVRFTSTIRNSPVELTYAVAADSFLLHVNARVENAPKGSALLVGLPHALQSNEPDTLDDIRHLAVSYRPGASDIESVGFSKLDSGEVRVETRPTRWLAARNKYFLIAYRTPAAAPFSTVQVEGGRRVGKVANDITAGGVLPLGADGTARFDIYAGPQDFERLRTLGADLDQVNPYGGFLRGLVQPFAVIVMRVLLWIKHTTHLNYGWVLVLFGVIVRLALWPLNQSAMRTSLKMQRLQPELQALQKKHSDDPRKQQEAIMKVYKDHGMSPLSPLMGCLPMLLPTPVLFALYFVFQNTIEFRGVPFLWLPDLSLRDPYFITPVLMGLSMFVMSWIGMRNSPPNPQAKMMMFMMPVMLTVFFFNLASGLNLYYAVQNVAAIPQQWLLARERGKEPVPSSPVVRGVPAAAQKRRG
jgi:YidC/Oxa1 family membrane protein insertase